MTKLSFLIVTSLFLSSLAYADSKVTLLVTLSPAGTFQAVSSKLKGNLVKEGGQFKGEKLTVSIESFKTGIDLRDEHFWKHLDPQKTHNKATLTNLVAENGKAKAELEVNGIKKPIDITYTEKENEVEAKFTVKASSFNLAKAEYLGVGVDDNVAVDVKLPFKTK